MNDRDLTVFMLALLLSAAVGAAETIIHFSPDLSNGVFNAVLTFSVAWGFYRLRS